MGNISFPFPVKCRPIVYLFPTTFLVPFELSSFAIRLIVAEIPSASQSTSGRLEHIYTFSGSRWDWSYFQQEQMGLVKPVNGNGLLKIPLVPDHFSEVPCRLNWSWMVSNPDGRNSKEDCAQVNRWENQTLIQPLKCNSNLLSWETASLGSETMLLISTHIIARHKCMPGQLSDYFHFSGA